MELKEFSIQLQEVNYLECSNEKINMQYSCLRLHCCGTKAATQRSITVSTRQRQSLSQKKKIKKKSLWPGFVFNSD